MTHKFSGQPVFFSPDPSDTHTVAYTCWTSASYTPSIRTRYSRPARDDTGLKSAADFERETERHVRRANRQAAWICFIGGTVIAIALYLIVG
jgi:hypothetical protein